MKSPFFSFSVGALALLVSGFPGAVAQEAVPAEAPAEAVVEAVVAVDETPQDPSVHAAEEFFAKLKAAEVDKAFDDLLKGSKIADVPKDVAMLKAKTREALKFAGAIEKVDLVGAKPVGHHLMGLTYISVGQSFPLRWRLYFYKTGEKWKLIDIRISDRLSEMFKEEANESSK